MPKATSAPKQVTASDMLHLTKYPKMVQRYFVNLDDKLTEVYRVKGNTQATEGAQLMDIITSTGNTHVFATQVTEVVKLTQAEKNREIARLKSEFESGKIDHKAFSDAITQLI